MQNELGPKAVVVTVFPDDNKKYLSTALLGNEPVRDDFLSTRVVLRRYKAFKRVCNTCCDPAECAETPPPGFVADWEPLPSCPRPRRS